MPHLHHSHPQNKRSASHHLDTNKARDQTEAPVLTLPQGSQLLYRYLSAESKVQSLPHFHLLNLMNLLHQFMKRKEIQNCACEGVSTKYFSDSSLCFQDMLDGGWNVFGALTDQDLQI